MRVAATRGMISMFSMKTFLAVAIFRETANVYGVKVK